MIKKLNQPFPDKADLKQSLLTILWVGVFVGLFLFLIRPFSIEGPWADLAWASAGFGAVTVVFGWIFEFVSRFVLKIETDGPNWTLGKWILMCIVLVVWIALGNFLFVNFLSGWKAMGYFSFVRMIGYTTLIGIFPVALSGVVIQLRATQKNEESASDISEHLHTEKDSVGQQTVVLEAENGQQLCLSLSTVRYVEAMQNYVTVWFLKDGKLTKEMLRATIASVEEKFAGTDVIRCHRSFLANVDCIEKVSGNAQGLRLQLKSVTEVEVPVSRSFIPKVRELLG
ncbi:MAG: LytTR family transcriptional regulator [Flavobacteriales bacterium]|nr:LytTR family transcriptional regulator [Flavobacteriales bacterium]MCB9190462.1 LytTR family transcriptional regulator [Flavobacteriales bacterium]MCB9205275.1 LytTR family transcriptional regulator [Flavobacteriales bacterium]